MDKHFPHKKWITEAILDVVPKVEMIFVFGSRAREDNKDSHADIDIGVIAEDKLSLVDLASIEDALDRLDTLYTIEVVDFTKREDVFTREALRKRKILYEKR